MPTVSLSLGEDRSYDIHVENGAIDRVGELAYRAGLEGKIALISDETVFRLYGERVKESLESAGFAVSCHVVPAGESSKSMAMVEFLCSSMVQAGVGRSGSIAALGGGVVGDLAGFVAAIYYRGIPFVQIPTTVVAQTDSSIGGKTAVNISEGKNLIGAFHQPAVVAVDPTTLVSLAPRILAEGMAEAVKHAAIRDEAMLDELRLIAPELTIGFSLDTIGKLPDLIARNIAIKARIVEEDETETLDIRALLNFGHTIGHGIEAARPYGEILHGEAVALGMRAALFLSCKLAKFPKKKASRILEVLEQMELPLQLPENVDPETVLQKTASDKKFKHGHIRFVLLDKAGKAFVSAKVTRQDIADAVAELQTPCC